VKNCLWGCQLFNSTSPDVQGKGLITWPLLSGKLLACELLKGRWKRRALFVDVGAFREKEIDDLVAVLDACRDHERGPATVVLGGVSGLFSILSWKNIRT
jgi:hypothetical protein